MGRRNTTRKAPAAAGKLAPALRAALAVADRALDELKRQQSKRKHIKGKRAR